MGQPRSEGQHFYLQPFVQNWSYNCGGARKCGRAGKKQMSLPRYHLGRGREAKWVGSLFRHSSTHLLQLLELQKQMNPSQSRGIDQICANSKHLNQTRWQWENKMIFLNNAGSISWSCICYKKMIASPFIFPARTLFEELSLPCGHQKKAEITTFLPKRN